MQRPNHASRFEGIAKTNLQASRASDTETLQSQVNKAAKKRLSLSELEILHGRLATSSADLRKTNARIKAVSSPDGGCVTLSLQLVPTSRFGERPLAARAIAA